MWVDSETRVDYLNFATVADSVVELIEQAGGKPLSIGVSGAWGVGKSSLVMQTRDALERREHERASDGGVPDDEFKSKYVFVPFNAWLYQGYDDARAALLDAIASELVQVAEERKTGVDKTREFLARVDWFRVASLTAGSAVALALGLPPVGLLGQVASLVKRGKKDGVDGELIEDGQEALGNLAHQGQGLVKDNQDDSLNPRQQIAGLRKSFEEALEALDVTLVVLIDDLDRCLPETAVSTLEAIRLFLFLKGTAFVIAADDQMIKHAVSRHFQDPSDDLVTNYFDKLIQIPIRVPSLGTQEVRAYMFLLYVENSSLQEEEKEAIRAAVCEQLQESWKGKRVDRQFVSSLGVSLSAELVAQLDTAERLTKLMTSSRIAGNPRLIKRFLNTLSVRMAVATRQGITVDERVLAKLLLFERLAPPALYSELAAVINDSPDGKPTFLATMEPQTASPTAVADVAEKADHAEDDKSAKPRSGKTKSSEATVEAAEPSYLPGWGEPFPKEWLALEPKLSDVDMRGAMYVSREHLPIITTDVGLSAEAAEVLQALIGQPEQAATVRSGLSGLPHSDLQRIFDSLLEIARREEEWGAPTILVALIEVSRGNPALESQLAAFIAGRPAVQIKAAIVPRIFECPWAAAVLDKWVEDPEVVQPVKRSIDSHRKK